VLSSRLEGGANVIGEAVTAGVPLIASRIPGTVGLLGANYPGYFPVGDTQQLARLLARAETEAEFLKTLRSAVRKHSPLFDPQRERSAWADLLAEIKTLG
jgi:glycosyltransferase involved in cell wall biosynthesis